MARNRRITPVVVDCHVPLRPRIRPRQADRAEPKEMGEPLRRLAPLDFDFWLRFPLAADAVQPLASTAGLGGSASVGSLGAKMAGRGEAAEALIGGAVPPLQSLGRAKMRPSIRSTGTLR